MVLAFLWTANAKKRDRSTIFSFEKQQFEMLTSLPELIGDGLVELCLMMVFFSSGQGFKIGPQESLPTSDQIDVFGAENT